MFRKISRPEWFHGLRAVIVTLASILSLIGAALGVLIPLGIIGDNNQPPSISGIELEPAIAVMGEQLRATVKVEDPELDRLDIRWRADVGTFVGPDSGKSVFYQPPEDGASFQLSVEVSDGNNPRVTVSRDVPLVSPSPIPTATPSVATPLPTPTPTTAPVVTPKPLPAQNGAIEEEPNDSFEQATKIEDNIDGTDMKGTLQNDDQDYFAFEAPRGGGAVRIDVKGVGQSFNVTLFRVRAGEEDHLPIFGPEEALEHDEYFRVGESAVETYYLAISADSLLFEVSYSIDLSLTRLPDAGDSPDTATKIQDASVADGDGGVGGLDEWDYYWFTASSGAVLTFRADQHADLGLVLSDFDDRNVEYCPIQEAPKAEDFFITFGDPRTDVNCSVPRQEGRYLLGIFALGGDELYSLSLKP